MLEVATCPRTAIEFDTKADVLRVCTVWYNTQPATDHWWTYFAQFSHVRVSVALKQLQTSNHLFSQNIYT